MKLFKITIFTIALLFLFSTATSFSQVKTVSKIKPAAFIIEWDFSYNQALPSMRGEIADFFTFKNYGVKYGVGSHINFKYSTDKKGRIRPYASLGYDMLINTNDNYAYIPANTTLSFPDANGSSYSEVPGKSRMWIHLFNASLGFEYAFTNKTKWTPYVNTDIGLNVIFGSYRQTPTSVAPPNVPGEITFTIKSAPRFGFGFGAGVDGRVTRIFGVAFGVKFKMPNLIGQESKLSTDLNKFELNDKTDVSINSLMTKNRLMNYLNFYIGATFYIGKK